MHGHVHRLPTVDLLIQLGVGSAGPAAGNSLARYAVAGPALTNPAPSKGDLMLRLGPPQGGSFDAIPGLTYNSLSPGHPAFGAGFDSDLTGEVEKLNESAVEWFKPSGTVLCFSNKDPVTGYYQSPAGAGSTLQKVADGWIERLPDQTQLHYDTSGRLDRLISVSGDIWTLSFVDLGGQQRLSSVLDPFGRRTTLSYDGAGYLSRVTDAAGRESQFTVDAQGRLTQYVTPELCVHGLEYNAQGRLGAYVDPEGSRFSYTYDVPGRLQSYENPLGARTTYAYVSGTQTEIQDALGRRTTLTFSAGGQLLSAEDALGRRTSYSWSGRRVASVEDPAGQRLTILYEPASHGRTRTAGVVAPSGAQGTFQYDAEGRLQSQVDALDHRITLVWNAAGQRIARQGPDGLTGA
jgi:YD repeat-containing protein